MATILVVHHGLSTRLYLDMLVTFNYTVICAKSGEQALAVLAKKSVDLVISDIAMPKMDGLTLLKALRANPRFEHLPIVMLTANKQQALKAQALGADLTLNLQLTIKVVLLMLTQLLPDHPTTQALTVQLGTGIK